MTTAKGLHNADDPHGLRAHSGRATGLKTCMSYKNAYNHRQGSGF